MTNLSDKFDQLPQEFDREAIWNGIQKPGRKPGPWANLAALFFLLSGIAGIFHLRTHRQIPADPVVTASTPIPSDRVDPSTTNTAPMAGNKERLTEPLENVLYSESTHLSERQPRQSITQETPQNMPSAKGASMTALPMSIPEVLDPISGGQVPDRSIAPDLVVLSTLPVQWHALVNTSPSPEASLLECPTPMRRPKRHSLAIGGVLGMHRSHFLSNDPAESQRRQAMEKPQASIGLGIRYAYDFNRGMRLSLAANYQLYKEKINTRAILDSMGQLYQVDYRLYSHFHVLTTQLELGKRWRWHDWFGDILGGAGMKWHQVSEVDYFTGEGKLADEDLVSRSYRPSTEPYVLGQAAVGKFLSPSLFCRMGVQVQSGFDLTSRDATVRHRIVPAHLFFEIGQRF